MTPPLHGTPDGDALRREPGAPVPVIQAPPVSTVQIAVVGLASLGISAAGAVSAVTLVTHSAIVGGVFVAVISVGGAVEALRRGLGWGAPDDDEPQRSRVEIERDRILDMIEDDVIGADDGRRLLAALHPATQVPVVGS